MILVWPDVDQPAEDARELLHSVDARLMVATWDTADDDGGRTALLTSLRDAREAVVAAGGDPDALDLVGFGIGAVAAAGLTRYAKRLGIGLGRVVCVAPRWNEPDPFSGAPVTEVPERVELVPDAASVAASW